MSISARLSTAFWYYAASPVESRMQKNKTKNFSVILNRRSLSVFVIEKNWFDSRIGAHIRPITSFGFWKKIPRRSASISLERKPVLFGCKFHQQLDDLGDVWNGSIIMVIIGFQSSLLVDCFDHHHHQRYDGERSSFILIDFDPNRSTRSNHARMYIGKFSTMHFRIMVIIRRQ